MSGALAARELEEASIPAARRWRWRAGMGQVALGLGLLAVITLAGVAAPWLTNHEPGHPDLLNRLKAPSWTPGGSPGHWMGTDHLGRDIYTRLLYGARVSLVVGGFAVLGSGLIGVTVGLIAGYYRGWVDRLFLAVADIQQSFPYLALAVAVVAVLGRGLTNLILVLAITGWILYARVVRGEVLSIRESEYVQAARSLGATDLSIMLRHILPGIRSPLIVVASFNFAQFIIAEASLTFLGLGVDPGTPSWGLMLSDSRNYLQNAWWYPAFPGLAMMLLVLGANLVGDGLRDIWDPYSRNEN